MLKLINIIIPAYNAEKTIVNTIKSIEKLNINNFLSIIITDDGSIDKTFDVISNYIKNSNLDIKLLQQKNSGEGEARNNGIKIADASYLIFLDSDDVFEQFNAKKIVKLLESNKYDMVIGGYVCDTKYKSKKYNLNDESIDNNKLIDGVCGRVIPAGIGNTFYRTSIIKNNDLYFGKYKYGADMEFVRRYVTKALSAKCVNEVIFRYNFNPNSVMNDIFNFNRIDSIKSVFDTMSYFEYHKIPVPSTLNVFLISEVRGVAQSYILHNGNIQSDFIDDLLIKYIPKKINKCDFFNKRRLFWLIMNLFFYKLPKSYLYIYKLFYGLR